MRGDPGPEREAVAEAGVGRVLDVRVQVHEAGSEHAAGQIDPARARMRRDQLGGVADRRDAIALHQHGAAGERRCADRHDPVGREERAHASLAASRRGVLVLRPRARSTAARDPDRDLEEDRAAAGARAASRPDRCPAARRRPRRAGRSRCAGSCFITRDERMRRRVSTQTAAGISKMMPMTNIIVISNG